MSQPAFTWPRSWSLPGTVQGERNCPGGLILFYLHCKLLPSDFKRSRITPRFIQLTLAHDEELDHLTQRVIIPQGGVKPDIHPALLPPREREAAIENRRRKQMEANIPNQI